jgi:hypothetical protein
MAMDGTVVKFPYSVSRRVHSRKPRKSINGTPEERAAKQAAGVKMKPVRPTRLPRVMTGDDFDEFVRLLEEPEAQQAFNVDAWKLVNRHFRRLARGD